MGSLVRPPPSPCQAYLLSPTEEFGIYLNYVRKLGFEETPDYDFLRELFAKVMKNNNDVDDGVYDWNLLNGASPIHLNLLRTWVNELLIRREGLGSLISTRAI